MSTAKILAIVLVFLILLNGILYWSRGGESFDDGAMFKDKATKAAAISSWFANNPEPSYNKYKTDMADKSNIVEYYMVRNRQRSGRPISSEDIVNVI